MRYTQNSLRPTNNLGLNSSLDVQARWSTSAPKDERAILWPERSVLVSGVDATGKQMWAVASPARRQCLLSVAGTAGDLKGAKVRRERV